MERNFLDTLEKLILIIVNFCDKFFECYQTFLIVSSEFRNEIIYHKSNHQRNTRIIIAALCVTSIMKNQSLFKLPSVAIIVYTMRNGLVRKFAQVWKTGQNSDNVMKFNGSYMQSDISYTLKIQLVRSTIAETIILPLAWYT